MTDTHRGFACNNCDYQVLGRDISLDKILCYKAIIGPMDKAEWQNAAF